MQKLSIYFPINYLPIHSYLNFPYFYIYLPITCFILSNIEIQVNVQSFYESPNIQLESHKLVHYAYYSLFVDLINNKHHKNPLNLSNLKATKNYPNQSSILQIQIFQDVHKNYYILTPFINLVKTFLLSLPYSIFLYF